MIEQHQAFDHKIHTRQYELTPSQFVKQLCDVLDGIRAELENQRIPESFKPYPTIENQHIFKPHLTMDLKISALYGKTIQRRNIKIKNSKTERTKFQLEETLSFERLFDTSDIAKATNGASAKRQVAQKLA